MVKLTELRIGYIVGGVESGGHRINWRGKVIDVDYGNYKAFIHRNDQVEGLGPVYDASYGPSWEIRYDTMLDCWGSDMEEGTLSIFGKNSDNKRLMKILDNALK